MKRRASGAVLAGAVACTNLAAAAALPSYDFQDCLQALDCRRLEAAELDRMRGGFLFMAGSSELELRIGISRAVFVNEELVAVTQQVLLPTLLREGTFLRNDALTAFMGGAASAPEPDGSGNVAASSTAGSTDGVGGTNGSNAGSSASSTPGTAGPSAAAVQVNGVPVLPNAPAVVDADALRALLIQNGPGNVAEVSAADIRARTMATVLQNTLDDQTIRTMTTLTATTNALSAFRDAAFREAISRATTDLAR